MRLLDIARRLPFATFCASATARPSTIRAMRARRSDRLFDEHVDGEVRPFVTHLPLYGLRAAATKFGEGMDSEQEGWVRVRAPESAAARGHVRRAGGGALDGAADSRRQLLHLPRARDRVEQGKRLLIEKFGETDFASPLYGEAVRAAQGRGSWNRPSATGAIRLEPLNPRVRGL